MQAPVVLSRADPKAQLLRPQDPFDFTSSATDLQVAQVPSELEVAHLSETQWVPIRVVPAGQPFVDDAGGPHSPFDWT